MPVGGARPKPPGQAVTRTPRLEFTEVPDRPYGGRPMPKRKDGRRWPRGMVETWRGWSRMPHCILWTDTDWAFAVESLHVAARTVESLSDSKWFAELRQRQRVMGTTLDARRDLRIRYVPVEVPKARSEVVELDEYRAL